MSKLHEGSLAFLILVKVRTGHFRKAWRIIGLLAALALILLLTASQVNAIQVVEVSVQVEVPGEIVLIQVPAEPIQWPRLENEHGGDFPELNAAEAGARELATYQADPVRIGPENTVEEILQEVGREEGCSWVLLRAVQLSESSHEETGVFAAYWAQVGDDWRFTKVSNGDTGPFQIRQIVVDELKRLRLIPRDANPDRMSLRESARLACAYLTLLGMQDAYLTGSQSAMADEYNGGGSYGGIHMWNADVVNFDTRVWPEIKKLWDAGYQ